jgi:hypothetical protein
MLKCTIIHKLREEPLKNIWQITNERKPDKENRTEVERGT